MPATLPPLCLDEAQHLAAGLALVTHLPAHVVNDAGHLLICDDIDIALWGLDQIVYTVEPEQVYCDASWSTAPVASADDDTRQKQPLGWCYVCGGASWNPVRDGFLCTSHLSDGEGDCPDCEPVRLDASWSTAPVASADELCVCGGVATLVVREHSCEAHICGLCFINDYENDVNGSLARTVEPLCSDNPPTDAPGGPLIPGDDGYGNALLVDIVHVLDMTLGHTHGNASIVGELRRVRARVQETLGIYHTV